MMGDSAASNRLAWLAFRLLIEPTNSYVCLELARISEERPRVFCSALFILLAPGQPAPRCIPVSSLGGCHFTTTNGKSAEGCGNLALFSATVTS